MIRKLLQNLTGTAPVQKTTLQPGDTRISKNFTLNEFTKSQTAIRNGIDNTPTDAHLAAAKMLFDNVVQRVRDEFGVTVINSGYRGPALNKKVKGSKRSQHCKGEAADIEVPGMSNYKLAKWIEANCEFDQLILEGYTQGDPGSGWVHVSYKSARNRKERLTATFVKGKAHYAFGINK